MFPVRKVNKFVFKKLIYLFFKQFLISTAVFITQLLKFGEEDEIEIQQFLQIYRVTANPNTVSGMFPADLMFVKKETSVFDRLLPEKKWIQKRKPILLNILTKAKKWVHKRHLKQLKKRFSDSKNTRLEEPLQVIYDVNLTYL